MSIVVTDVIAEYGGYYVKGQQNMQRLTKELYRDPKTASFFNIIPTEDTRLEFSDAHLSRILQSYQNAFTPVASITFVPNIVELFKMKVDAKEYPDDIEKTWLGFLAGNSLSRTDWPFVRWLIEEHILPRMREDEELLEIYNGVFAAPVANTPGAAGASMNGLKKIINDYITDSRIDPVVVGAAPADPEDYCTYVENFFAGIPHQYRPYIDFIFMNEDRVLKYRQGKRAKYNANYAQEELDTLADYANVKVMGLPSMGTSTKLWATPKSNRVGGLKRAQGQSSLQIEGEDRSVKLFGDYHKGVGFALPNIVFTNDVELV